MQKFLTKEKTGIWVLDVQEKLFPLIDRHEAILENICFAIEAAKLLGLRIFVTEQYPEGLGETVSAIKNCLPEGQILYPKTSFSGYKDPNLRKAVEKDGVDTWILVGIEAHICVLQTAKDLLADKKNVVILNDAISSRSMFDFSTAMGELRECGARISSTETVIYEIVRDASAPEFKALLPLVKQHA